MTETARRFLRTLLETPSPSGFEQPIQAVVREYARGFADDVRTDRHGNVYVTSNPTGRPRVMLAGHCDQIGLMVTHIDSDGFLSVQPVGGWDMQILLGQHMTLWTATGPVPGVLSRKAVHLLTPDDRTKVPGFTDVWLDIGAKSKDDAASVVRVGDPVTVALRYADLRNGLATSPAMDDKVGLWVVMEAARRLQGRPVQAAVSAVSTVAEEVGLRGATTATHRVRPDIGIAVDVTHATDTPSSDKKQFGDIKLGGGPVVFRGPNVSPRVFELLERTATENRIPIQVVALAKAAANDGNVMQLSRDGVAVGIIGIPNRYMHSPVEVVHLEDLENAAKLLAELCAGLTADTNLIP